MRNLILIILAPIILAGCTKAISQDAIEQAETTVNSSIVIEESFKDLGTIAMDKGDVDISYTLTNEGKESVVIKEMYTSCMCTSARVSIGDDTSRKVGMKGHGGNFDILKIIEPGEQAVVTATFDPNAHGPQGTGLARRTISLETNSKVDPILRLDFEANVVKTSAEVPTPISYTDIDSEELNKMLEQEDLFLVDVHIPEQERIEGTDLFVPYNEIKDNIEQFPANKDAKIVFYCRSGNMSMRASEDLIKAGYTNVYNLVGGKNAYDELSN
jgi:rhodanese-related sulfurtransferase